MKFKFKPISVIRRLIPLGKTRRIWKVFAEMIYNMWREEFSKKAFKLSYRTPEGFTRCMWQKSQRVLLLWIIYRFIMAAFFVVTFISAAVPSEANGTDDEEFLIKFCIFLTHWTYFLETFYFVLGFVIVVIKARKEKGKEMEAMGSMPSYYKLFWIAYSIVLPGTFAVAIIFWIAVYDPKLFKLSLYNFLLHGVNAAMMLIEFILVAHPLRFLHFFWPLSYAILYLIFSAIYQLSGGTGLAGSIPIYNILDWRNPCRTLIVGLSCTLFYIFLYFLFAFLSSFKFWIKKKVTPIEEP